ncbi:MAG: hypothetical protein AAF456_01160 [Planctomycetota bacterium]
MNNSLVGLILCMLTAASGASFLQEDEPDTRTCMSCRILDKWNNSVVNCDTVSGEVRMARLLGFVEGSLAMEAPEEWRRFVLGSVAEDGLIDFAGSPVPLEVPHSTAVRNIDGRVPPGVEFPEDIREKLRSPLVAAGIARFDGTVYVHIRSMAGIYGTVYCFDEDDREVVWEARTSSSVETDDLVIRTGINPRAVEIKANDSYVVVFGKSTREASVVAFDRNDGREVCRATFITSANGPVPSDHEPVRIAAGKQRRGGKSAGVPRTMCPTGASST